MNRKELARMFYEALRERGISVDEVNHAQKSEPSVIVHWTDGIIHNDYFNEKTGDVHYLNVRAQVGDAYIEDVRLSFCDEDTFSKLQRVVNHFKSSIEPLELKRTSI